MTDDQSWNYFFRDMAYVDVLADRLRDGVEMDSALGLANLIRDRLSGDLAILDFGSGPGHYAPVLKRVYDRGALSYRGIDIVPESIAIGNAHFAADPTISFEVGSALDPAPSYRGENVIFSANTLPHIPAIAPLFRFMAETPGIETFAFRMLIGRECVQIRKHLSDQDFSRLFDENYQFNNIYSVAYLERLLGDGWTIEVHDDHVDTARLEQHAIPAQHDDPFYANRVSRPVAGMTFKGDVYMPWKLVLGRRSR